MSNKYRALAFLMSTNIETVFIVMGVWVGSKWLDESYPIKMPWIGPLGILGILAIAKIWWRLFSQLMKDYKKETQGDKDI